MKRRISRCAVWRVQIREGRKMEVLKRSLELTSQDVDRVNPIIQSLVTRFEAKRTEQRIHADDGDSWILQCSHVPGDAGPDISDGGEYINVAGATHFRIIKGPTFDKSTPEIRLPEKPWTVFESYSIPRVVHGQFAMETVIETWERGGPWESLL